MKIITISSSFLDNLEACFQKYDYSVDRQLTTVEGNSALEKGIIMHKGLEHHYNCIRENLAVEELRKANLPGVDVAVQTPYNEIVNQSIEAIRTAAIDTSLDKKEIDEVIEIYQQYAIYRHGESWKPVAVEQVFSVLLYEDEIFPWKDGTFGIKIIFEGQIDAVFENEQGQVMIVDHKTMSGKKTFSKLNNQFQGYPFALSPKPADLKNISPEENINTLPVMINKLVFAKTTAPNEKFSRQDFSYTWAELKQWMENTVYHILEYERLKDNLGNENLPKRFSSCQSGYFKCEFEIICSSQKEVREEKLRIFFKRNTSYRMFKD